MHMLEVVVAAVEVVVGYMLELELDISSCNDVSKLEVVVELVELGLLGVLGALVLLGHLELLVLLEALEVLLVLAHLGHQVVPWVLEYRVVLELVVVVVVVGVVGVGVVVEEARMAQLVLMEW